MLDQVPNSVPGDAVAVLALDDGGIKRRAGELALELAAMAAHTTHLTLLARDVAGWLAEALKADMVELFWIVQPERGTKAARHALRGVGAHAHAGVAGRALRTKPTAYRALSRGESIARAARSGDENGAGREWAIALPLGAPAPWAVCAVTWYTAEHDPRRETALLEALAPALALALRPAHAAHEQRRRRPFFQITSEALVAIGQDFIVQDVNPAFVSALGWHDRSPIGVRCSDVLCCRDERKMILCETQRCPLRQAFGEETAPAVRELSWRTTEGALKEVSASVSVQREEADPWAIIAARDVTAVNTANRMRANFISMVSHELRTPLNSINGFLEIVLDGQTGPLNERQQEFLHYARISTQQLTALVEDIVLIGKADSGQFTLRVGEVDIAELAGRALAGCQPEADKARVRLAADVPAELPPVWGDELRLVQVLNNLLSNAIKFSPPDTTITLQARVDEDEVRLSVRDEGKGVPLGEQSRIFERFYQSETSGSSRAGGYGLGLAIAKLIVEQHQGRIWVESEPPAGATFVFTAPIVAGE
jgi:signal transduction histidine kinase